MKFKKWFESLSAAVQMFLFTFVSIFALMLASALATWLWIHHPYALVLYIPLVVASAVASFVWLDDLY
jgi:hypothetical protein